MRILALLTLLSLATPSSRAQPQIAFEVQSVVGTITPGGQAFWHGLASGYYFHEHRDSIQTADQSGAVRIDVGRLIAVLEQNSLYALVDLTTGQFAVAKPTGTPSEYALRDSLLQRDPAGRLSRIFLRGASDIWFAVARPGVGAWNGFFKDGYEELNLLRDGVVYFDVSRLTPVSPTAAPLQSIEPDDIILATMEHGSLPYLALTARTALAPTPGAGKLQFFGQNSSAKEGQTAYVFVQRLDGSSGTASVQFRTEDETARAGLQYTAVQGTLTFGPGETMRVIEIPLLNDDLYPSGRFRVLITSPEGGASLGALTDHFVEISDDEPRPLVTLSAPSALQEGDGPLNIPLTFTLDRAMSLEETVTWRAWNALSGEGVVTFAPGETTKTASLPVAGDTVPGPDRTVRVWISGTRYALSSAEVSVNVIDDDLSACTVGDASVIEGDSGSQTLRFPVSWNYPSYKPATVGYATRGGSAQPGTDFVPTSGTITDTTTHIDVSVVGDLELEDDEIFYLDLSSPVNATITRPSAQGTIVDDDRRLPSVSIADATTTEGDTLHHPLYFNVTLSFVPKTPVTVLWATADGTAKAGMDYIAAQGVVTFAAGDTERIVAISVVPDLFKEPTETMTVALSSPTGATLGRSVATGTIHDNDPYDAPVVHVDDIRINEGNTVWTQGYFKARIAEPAPERIVLRYSLASGSAIEGLDFYRTVGEATLEPGSTSAEGAFVVIGDTIAEPDETFTINLLTFSRALLARPTATVTIVDDDPTVITIDDATQQEGGQDSQTDMRFSVRLQMPLNRTSTVRYRTEDGTALAGQDYVAASGTLTFPEGTVSQQIVVRIIGDASAEPNESFQVILSDASDATVARSATGLIVDDDHPIVLPVITVQDASVLEGNSGFELLKFTARLSSPGSDVAFDWATQTDSASADDFEAASGTAAFGPEELEKTLTVRVVGDTRHEENETLRIMLSNPRNATLARSHALGHILNDDPYVAPLAIDIDHPSVTEGDQGMTPLTFTLSLNSASSSAVSVHFASADGTAAAGLDYQSANGEIIFAPGEIQKTVAVLVMGDTEPETDEFLTLELSNPTGASLARTIGQGTILDDDSSFISYPSIVFGSGSSGPLTLDLHVPKTGGPHPLLLWMNDDHWAGTRLIGAAKRQLDRGFAVAVVGFRPSATARFPAQLHDLREALLWLRKSAAPYSVDGSRIVAWGSGSGGHLAALLAISPEEDVAPAAQVDAAIAWSGVYDLKSLPPSASCGNSGTFSAAVTLLGCSPADCAQHAWSASPLAHIQRGSSPLLIVHAENDCDVPVSQATALHDALTRERAHSLLRILPGATRQSAEWSSGEVERELDAFLDEAVRKQSRRSRPARR